MFKIICDVRTEALQNKLHELPEGEIAPAARKYGMIISFKNCEACDVGDLKLTSTSEVLPTYKAAGMAAALDQQYYLNPVNKQYYEAYSNIIDQGIADSFDKFKYVSIFENDPGLHQAQIYLGPSVVQVFEAIVDQTDRLASNFISNEGKDYYETGYKEYHRKYSFLNIINSTGATFITFGTLKKRSDTDYAISKPAVAYILRHKGALDCPEMQHRDSTSTNNEYLSHNGEIYNKYISSDADVYSKFIQREFAGELLAILSLMPRYCTVGNEVIALMNVGTTSDTLKLCTFIGGTVEPMSEVIKQVCEKGKIAELSGNGFFAITCDNYKHFITFDAEGEIVNDDLIATTSAIQHQGHNEL